MEKNVAKNKRQINRHCSNLFSFIRTGFKIKNTHFMNVLILENSIQDLISSNCGEFQLYFYKNLFDLDEKSKILRHQTLDKSTLETIINEIFQTDINENEHIIKNFKVEYEL